MLKVILEWIVDTGATDHVINNTACYSSFQDIRGTRVMLPNGRCVKVTHIGDVQLFAKIILRDVFCVPEFEFNLLFVSKLTKTYNCCLVFYGDHCEIQSGPKREMIGYAKEQGGLYKFQKAEEGLQLQPILSKSLAVASSCNNFDV